MDQNEINASIVRGPSPIFAQVIEPMQFPQPGLESCKVTLIVFLADLGII